jgi:hypothetical protein
LKEGKPEAPTLCGTARNKSTVCTLPSWQAECRYADEGFRLCFCREQTMK